MLAKCSPCLYLSEDICWQEGLQLLLLFSMLGMYVTSIEVLDNKSWPQVQQASAAPAGRPPLQEITYIHAAIRSALESFAVEAHSMKGSADITAIRMKALVDKHRFLRSVCTFHSASEDEVLLPAARFAPASCFLL